MDNSYRARAVSPTVGGVDWEHLFDDLEGQLAAEWEAERAALDAESERLRIAKLTLRDRLRAMQAADARLLLELGSGDNWHATLSIAGADWVGVHADGDSRLRIVPLAAIESVGVDHGVLLDSLTEREADRSLRGRMSFGFVLRDLARRRVPVTIGRRGRDPHHGTIDRAGSDHLDLALHDAHASRSARTVRGFRSIPLTALSWVRVEDATADL